MEKVGWPSNYLAKCRVALFECQEGGQGWKLICSMGELYIRPLGSAVVLFQLYHPPSGRVILEHTMHKAEGFSDPTSRFFVIRSENGRFQAFGFEDKTEACEMRYQIEKAVKPYSLKTTTLCGDAAACDADDKLMGSPGISTAQKHLEPLPADTTTPHPSVQTESASSRWRKHKPHRWHKVLKGFQAIARLFDFGNDKLPRDSMHDRRRSPESWLDTVESSNYVTTAPIRMSDGFDGLLPHHTIAKGAGGHNMLPPPPPAEFLDSPDTTITTSTQKSSTLRRRHTTSGRKTHRRSVSG